MNVVVSTASKVCPLPDRSDEGRVAAPTGVLVVRMFPELPWPPHGALAIHRAALVASTDALGATLAVRWSVTRGMAGLLRVAAIDALRGPVPLALDAFPVPRSWARSNGSRPDGTCRPAVSPPVGGPVRPPGRDAEAVDGGEPDLDPGTPAHRLFEAFGRFERRVLGLVEDANPGLRAGACIAEARRLAQIHWHRLIVRELLDGLVDRPTLAAALAAGLPGYTGLMRRVAPGAAAFALESLAVLDVLSLATGGDDPDDPARALGAILLARPPASVGSEVAEVRRRRFARALVDAQRLGLPSGQQVALALDLDPVPPNALARCWPAGQRATIEAPNLAEHTPLPLYVLLEAVLEGTGRLGPVGTRLLAEGLLGPIRQAFPERPIDPRERLERAGLRDREGRPLIGLVDLLRFIGAAGLLD